MEKTIEINGDEFILVEAEELSLEDEFMKFKPHTRMEKDAKELISEAIRMGVKNFYRPKCDPSFAADGESIRFVVGKKPAVGKSYNWWKKSAKEFCPERNSRLGTKSEYVAFLGVFIKKLVESGSSIDDAWNAVCDDSRELGHYYNSVGALRKFEPTGSRAICGFCDLANTYKILAKDKEVFWIAGGDYRDNGFYSTLADLIHDFNRGKRSNYGVGWIVLEK